MFILPIKNYNREQHSSPAIDAQALDILEHLLSAARSYYRDVYNKTPGIPCPGGNLPPPTQPEPEPDSKKRPSGIKAALKRLKGVAPPDLYKSVARKLEDEEIIRCHDRTEGDDELYVEMLTDALDERKGEKEKGK